MGKETRWTYLQAADKSIRDVVLKERTALVVFAAPAPDILAISVGFTLVQDSCADTPHDDTKDKEKNSESGVVDGDLLGSIVTAAKVTPEDNQAHE
jgi:hypothetical protein